MTELEGVGLRVKAVRLASGLNGREFASTFDCDQSKLSRIESSKDGLSIRNGINLAKYWDVSLDFLYRGDLTRARPEVISAYQKLVAEMGDATKGRHQD